MGPQPARGTPERPTLARHHAAAGSALLIACCLLLALGCGPSYEAVYQGNVRFEHCFRLDHDQRIASTHREYCWNQWVQAYTYGQPQDRVDYAKRRIRVLRGEPPPGSPPQAPPAEQAPQEPVAAEVAPIVAAPVTAAPVASAAPSPAVELPGDSCALGCREALGRCRKGCQTAPKGCVPCEPEYNACMRQCFE